MVSCSLCGRAPDPPSADAPLGWMADHDARRGVTWTCPECARRFLRSIEGKLDQAWW